MEQIFEGQEGQQVETTPMADDWLQTLFGETRTVAEKEVEEQSSSEKKQTKKSKTEELSEQVEALRAQLALMQLNTLVERAKAEFYQEKPYLREYSDIIEKLASVRISEILSSGQEIDDLSKVTTLVKGALNDAGKQIEERFGLGRRSTAAELVGLPPSNVATTGEGAPETEYSDIPGVEMPISKNVVAKIISLEDLDRWRRETAKKMIEERIKDMRKRQQGWVEGYRR